MVFGPHAVRVVAVCHLAVHVFVELEFKDPKDQDGVGFGWFSEVGS